MRIFNRNKLPKGIEVSIYKLDKWVYTAFKKMKLDFEGKTVKGKMRKDSTFFRETTITRIGSHENKKDGTWKLYVNGAESTRPIDDLLDVCEIKSVRFIYVMKTGAPPQTPLVPIPDVRPSANRVD
jgi:hypothetical protein